MKLKKKLPFRILFILLSGIVLVGGYLWWNQNSHPLSSDTAEKRFIISRGLSASEIGQKLYKEGLIRNPLAFKIYVQVKGIAKKIQPGMFSLSAGQPLTEVVKKLTKNPDELVVKIPEGLRREEVIEIIISGLEIDEEESSDFRAEFLKETEGKEGYLFPDTYYFLPGTDVDKVVSRLTGTFEQKVKELGNNYPDGYSLNDIVILASLIEREAITNEERPIVAGILYNRLRDNWPLQVDAAVQYAIANSKCKIQNAKCDWWPKNLTKEDLEIASPYNTYKFSGMPPAPISNPGFESLKAAVNPVASNYYFYIHADGKIYYAKTLEEHNINIRKYLGK